MSRPLKSSQYLLWRSGVFLRSRRHRLIGHPRPTGDAAVTDGGGLHPPAALVAEALILACLADVPLQRPGGDDALRQCVQQRWLALGSGGLRQAWARAWRLSLVAIASAVDREGRLWPHLEAGWSAVELLIRDFDAAYLFPFADEADLLPRQRAELRRDLMHVCGLLLVSPATPSAGEALDWASVDFDDVWPVGDGLDDLALPAASQETVATLHAQPGEREGIPTQVCGFLSHRDLLSNTLRYFLYRELIGGAGLEPYSPFPEQAVAQARRSTGWIASLRVELDRAQQLFAGMFPQLLDSLDLPADKLREIAARRETEDAEIEARLRDLWACLQQELKDASDLLAWLESRVWPWGSQVRELFTLDTYLGRQNGRSLYSAVDRRQRRLFVEVTSIGTGEEWLDNTVQSLARAARAAQTASPGCEAGCSLAQQEFFVASPTPHLAERDRLPQVHRSDEGREIKEPLSLALPSSLTDIVAETIKALRISFIDMSEFKELNKYSAPGALAPMSYLQCSKSVSDSLAERTQLLLDEYIESVEHGRPEEYTGFESKLDDLVGRAQRLLDSLWRLIDLLRVLGGATAVAGPLPREQNRRLAYLKPGFVEAGVTPMSSMADVESVGHLPGLALHPDLELLQDVATRLVHDVFLYRIAHPGRLEEYRRVIQSDPLFGLFRRSVLARDKDPRVVSVAASLLRFIEPVTLAEKLGEDAVVILALLGEPLRAVELGETLLLDYPDNLWLHHNLALLHLWQADEAWRAQ